MKYPAMQLGLAALALAFARLSVSHGQTGSNSLPQVSITWPRQGDSFSMGAMLIKIKAEAFDADGSIAQVQFFADANLIGSVTNPPYNLLWVPDERTITLKAVAVDNQGAIAESKPVMITGNLGPPMPVVEIISPRDGALFATPATFDFSAELLSSPGDAGSVEFFVGTDSRRVVTQSNYLFSVTTTPYTITVSNLVEGEYKLHVRYHGSDGGYCECERITNTVRVVILGVQSSRLTPDGHFQFEVVTSFPLATTVIEASSNLVDWWPISTNSPAGNVFVFVEPALATESHRFYRAVIPPPHPVTGQILSR